MKNIETHMLMGRPTNVHIEEVVEQYDKNPEFYGTGMFNRKIAHETKVTPLTLDQPKKPGPILRLILTNPIEIKEFYPLKTDTITRHYYEDSVTFRKQDAELYGYKFGFVIRRKKII
jgi:hypothetical protein